MHLVGSTHRLSLSLALTLACACSASSDATDAGSDDAAEVDDGSSPEPDGGEDDFEPVDPPTCAPLDLSRPIGTVRLERMFEGDEALTRPTDMRVLPDGRAFLVSQDGIVWTAPEVSPGAELTSWLDLTDVVEARQDCCREEGMFSIAFHPRFDDNGQVFVMYSEQTSGRWSNTVISRFVVKDPSMGRPDRDSERVLVRVPQPSSVHNGGQLRFGPDGMLYWSLGDGGGNRDPQGNGQDTSTLLGAISRVDVDGATDSEPYAIPSDNPFVDVPGAAPELFAYGFRNAWRFAFHPQTGEIWSGDVGQGDFEELNVVVAGGNYGWKVLEGNACQAPDPEYECSPPNYEPPLHVYDHEVGVSITGGVFYAGSDLPLLAGRYLFADFGAGTLWQVRGDESAGYEVLDVMDTGLQVAGFATDADGEVYLIDWGGAAIHRLAPVGEDGETTSPRWARKLSDTGCFSDLEERRWAGQAVPYDVRMPLWSDGADKERAVAVPDGSRIDAHRGSPDTAWTLPVGTTTAKTFLRDGEPLETRFLVHVERGRWLGATYAWNADGEDGELLPDERITREVNGDEWTFPSRSDCGKCHTRASSGVLGLRTAQLVDTEADPLEALEDVFVEPPASSADGWPRLNDTDEPVEQRARAYLASNCAHCHRPGGPTPTGLDLRFATPLADMGACDTEPRDDLGVPEARVIAPGDPDASVLVTRMASEDPHVQMPPLARSKAHVAAVDVVREWILDLQDCEE